MENIKIRNAKLIFRNLAGAEKEYNSAGDRNVGIVIRDERMVQELIQNGWNVKQTKPREGFEDEFVPEFYIQAKLKYRDKSGNLKTYPPTVYIVKSNNEKVLLDEDTVGQIDHAEIQDVRVELSPYAYEYRGKSGIAAYITRMYVKVIEDDFENFEELDDPFEIN